MAELRIRTGIPDEIAGHWVAFANVFERPERPGQLSVMLVLEDEQRQILAPGDRFSVGGAALELRAIESSRDGHVVVLDLADPPATAPAEPALMSFALPPITPGALVGQLRQSTPDILERLGARQVPLDWTESRSSQMHREWNGAEIGPVGTTRLVARFAMAGVAAEIAETDIRYDPETVHRMEVSGYWRGPGGRVHVFAEAAGLAPVTALQAAPAADEIAALLVAAMTTRRA